MDQYCLNISFIKFLIMNYFWLPSIESPFTDARFYITPSFSYVIPFGVVEVH